MSLHSLKRCISSPRSALRRILSTHKSEKCSSLSSASKIDYNSAKPYKDIPSELDLPLIGTSWIYLPIVGKYNMDRLVEANRDMRRRFGDVYRMKAGSFNIVISNCAEDLETIMKSEGKYPFRGEFESLKLYRQSKKDFFKTTGLLVLQGPEWLALRQKTQKHMLKPKAAEGYLDPMQDVAKDLVRRIVDTKDSNNEVPDLQIELHKWALESIAYVGLDARLGALDSVPDSDGMRMIDSVLAQFSCMQRLEPFMGNFPLWKYVSTPTWRKFVDASDVFAQISSKYIEKAIAGLPADTSKDDDNLTLLQCLLLKENMDTSDAIVHLADMLMAGIETTTYSVAFLLYFLAKHTEEQEILYKEIKNILPTNDSRISRSSLQEFKYLRACMKESMRLVPVIGGNSRVLMNDCVIGGYQVPAGTLAAVAYHEVQTDEKYFERAKSFVPERWLSREAPHHPYAYVPFGFGVRSCIGRRLAELEIVCIVAEIIRKFRIEYHHEDIGVFTHMVSVPDKPLRLNFIQR